MRGPGLWLVLLLLVVVMVQMLMWPTQVENKEISYSEFLQLVQDEKISQLMVSEYNAYGLYKDSTISESSFPERYDFTLQIPNDVASFYDDVKQVLATARGVDPESITPLDYGFTLVNQPAPQPAWWVEWIPFLIMILLLVAFWFFFMRQQMGGNNKVMNFGKAHARTVTDDKNRVTFAQVAGADEEKEELREIVEFLKHSDRFMQLGARIPKGVLLIGPPGTGKTLLAKAVAGEAGVPFFSISGSDFVEMFVGVGASRVRDLFEQAKRNAPAIIFIDEIDAVGRQRGAGLGGGHDEREQTLNQLLVEMDGFTANQGVIVLAATNRPDILDHALLRPGRFDRQVTVNYPDVKGREEILKVHSKGKPLGEDVSLAMLARRTPYMTGADLENVMNEAAILAARRNAKVITMRELEEAITRVQVGPEKKSRVITEKDKELVAFHEAGHAVLAYVLPGCDAVHEVSIIPRGGAGGYTMTMPDEEKHYVSGARLRDQIVELLGGHVAEKIVLGDVSTGSTSDLSRASELARKMITEYGMNDEIGPVYLGGDQEVFVGRDFGHARNYSEELAARVDEQLEKTLHAALDRATQLLNENREKLDRIARELINREKLDKEEFAALMRGEELPPLDGGKNPIESILNA
ncbi:MAG TPA: ATP-dependent zinc metalloprotease FtsH [Candidatus Spyradocola merdavium]|nr:ATP-dependent zinc metalloprotease FtsH [Candidatus Spyradocola merdavium]